MIFVKNSHFVWDPTRQRKLRKKLGNLVKSPKDTLDDMLEQHIEEVQALLLEKKSDFEEMNDLSSRTDEGPQTMATGLRSPPLPSGAHTPKHFERGARQESGTNLLKSPRMPPVGMFGVSPKSPRSPIKRMF
jgi:histone deacetylase 6